jgi:secernin
LCDTFVVLPPYTKSNSTIFGKNSDREPNEAQVVEYYPRGHSLGDALSCTHITITQVPETFAVVLSRPFWMYGAEMGVNEFGVSIGNEAIFSNQRKKATGLLGMDILRLGLERSKDAKTAVSVLTALLDSYGQGGTNSFFREYLYDNSFLISDKRDAWVLESAGEFWAAKQVHDYYSISNVLTLHSDYDCCSESLSRRAHSQRVKTIDFAKEFSDRLYTGLGKGSKRLQCTRSILSRFAGQFDLEAAKSLLRSHDGDHYEGHGDTGDVCMHSGGMLSPDQTASSMITTFKEDKPIAHMTGSSLPCCSVFKPHIVAGDDCFAYTSAREKYDPNSFWWRIEKVHRSFMQTPEVRDSLLELEAEFENEFDRLFDTGQNLETMVNFTKSCYAKEVITQESHPLLGRKTNRYWKKLNEKALLSA